MTPSPGPRWAVSYRPKLAAPETPDSVLVVETESAITALKTVQAHLATRQDGPFVIIGFAEAAEPDSPHPVLPPIGEPT